MPRVDSREEAWNLITAFNLQVASQLRGLLTVALAQADLGGEQWDETCRQLCNVLQQLGALQEAVALARTRFTAAALGPAR